MRTTVYILLSLCLLLSAGEDGPAENRAERKAVAVRPTVNVLTRYLDRADIHPPAKLGRLTVFPISLSRTNRLDNVLTMTQALDKKLLVIEEMKSAQVPKARFVNKSGKMIFLMAGEIITGGKQNRTLTTDALLGPDSVTVLPVYCVQRGRWAGKKRFSAGTMAPQGVREKAAQKAGQSEVWSEVARANRRLKSTDASGDLAVAMVKPENIKRMKKLRNKIVPKLPKNCVGIVVAKDKRIIGADLFNSPELFAAMREKVLDAYLSQYSRKELAVGPRGGLLVPRPSQDDVRKYLQACYKSRFTPGAMRGVGRIFNISGTRFGQTLTYARVHIRTYEVRIEIEDASLNFGYMVHTSLMQKIVPVKPKVSPPSRRPQGRR
ncbi:MAG: hypothetical protein KAV00_05730 [Phycisphaerae bacterium]|nr:hypothetical protein [Phycisphaerae bacterium]